jgi:hypothetical protein
MYTWVGFSRLEIGSAFTCYPRPGQTLSFSGDAINAGIFARASSVILQDGFWSAWKLEHDCLDKKNLDNRSTME